MDRGLSEEVDDSRGILWQGEAKYQRCHEDREDFYDEDANLEAIELAKVCIDLWTARYNVRLLPRLTATVNSPRRNEIFPSSLQDSSAYRR